MRSPRFIALVAVVAAASLLSACGSSSKTGEGGGDSTTLRLGYFPNVTHAPAIIGIEKGTFASKVGPDVKLDLKTFNAGSEAVTAMLAGELDASFIGPNPAINSYQKTDGATRIVSGAALGGAYLVVSKDIDSAADLKGKTVATPQLGNTQDVALRSWLNAEGLHQDKDGGDVTILPQENALTLTAFQEGNIKGAWVPEPWATRLVKEGDGKVLVDEADLWPDGKYVTTVLVVTKKFLDAHPDVIENLIAGVADTVALIESDPKGAQAVVNTGIEKITGKPLADDVIAASFDHITFTQDPATSALQKSADDAKSLGFLESSDLGDIFDLTLLNKVLVANGEPEITS